MSPSFFNQYVDSVPLSFLISLFVILFWCRGEAIPVHVGRMHVEVCEVG